MKFSNFFKILITLIFTINTSNNAFIFSKRTFKNESQELIGWGDIHLGISKDATHPDFSFQELKTIHQKQAKDLISSIKEENQNIDDTLVILEEMSYIDCKNEKHKEIYLKRNNLLKEKYQLSCFLDEFYALCKKDKINVINVEFRYSLIIFFNFGNIPAKEFLKDLNEILNLIANYNDNDVLNDYYKQLVANVKSHKKLLEILNKNKDKCFSELESNISQEMKWDFMQDCFPIIDAKIIHSIYENKNKKNIHICAGDNHIKRVEDVLSQMNFTKADEQFNIIDSMEYPLEMKTDANQNHTIYVILFMVFYLSLIVFVSRIRFLDLIIQKLRSLYGSISN